MASAYTSVQTSREGFGDQQAQSEADQRTVFSQPVRAYVSRAFATENAIEGVSQEEVSTRLKDLIGNVARQGLLETTPWDTLPLPQQIIQHERTIMANAHAHAQAQAAYHAAAYAASWAQPSQYPTNHSEPAMSAKKRRLDDLETTSQPSTPWSKQKTSRTGLASRVTYDSNGQAERAEKKSKHSASQFEPSSKFQEELEQRRRRFEHGSQHSPTSHHSIHPFEEETPAGPIVGTCQTLEKEYFRLTSPPKPSEVRPLAVLKETLKLLRSKWRKEQKYSYICSQFKSLRQDLTVQRIKNSFTVEVYELHARIALEQGDLGEYNQCQTQLRSLYSLNLGGNPAEFLGYRILYFVHTANRTDMNKLLAELTEKDKEDPAVTHALQTRAAVASGNYHKLFRLYLSTPNMGGYLMDKFVERERLLALNKICST
jgi:SAC3 family protein LENG8/THP3